MLFDERKHGVSFVEAMEIFDSSSVADPEHSIAEHRYLIFGVSKQGRHNIVVSYTERGAWIRLISARLMTPRERRAYEQ